MKFTTANWLTVFQGNKWFYMVILFLSEGHIEACEIFYALQTTFLNVLFFFSDFIKILKFVAKGGVDNSLHYFNSLRPSDAYASVN